MKTDIRYSRRGFCAAACASVLAVSARRLFGNDPGWTVLSIPASQMKDRAAQFRKMMWQSYLQPKLAVPVFELMTQAKIIPQTIAQERELGALGGIATSGNSLVFSKPAPGRVIDATFPVELYGKTFDITVSVPGDLSIGGKWSADQFSFEFGRGMLVGIPQTAAVKALPIKIPPRMLLQSIVLDDSQLTYYVVDPTPTGMKLRIKMDFAAAPNVSVLRGLKSWLLITCMMCFIWLTGCTNFGDATGGPNPYPDKEVCYNAPAPDGYIRIGSKAAGLSGCPSPQPNALNVNVYTNYSQQPVKTQLQVCSDAPIPNGWMDISGSFHSEDGCDYQKYTHTGYANVRTIYKCETPSAACQH